MTSKKSVIRLEGRPYQRGDEKEIVRIYNLITGRNRTPHEHLDLWKMALEGPISSWVIEDKARLKLVGHHGMMPMRFHYTGRLFRVGKTENTIFHPDYQGSGAYYFHEKRFLNQASEQFDFMFTTSGHGTPGKLRKKLGYQAVSTYAFLMGFTSVFSYRFAVDPLLFLLGVNAGPLKLFFRYLVWLLGLPLSLFIFFTNYATVRKTDFQDYKIDDIGGIGTKELEYFKRISQESSAIRCEPTLDLLKAHVFDQTNGLVIFVKKHGHIVGHIASCMNKTLSYCSVIDLHADEDDQEVVNFLINILRKACSKNSICLIVFLTLNAKSKIFNLTKRAGFSYGFLVRFFHWSLSRLGILPPFDSKFLVYSPREDLQSIISEAKLWHFTCLMLEPRKNKY